MFYSQAQLACYRVATTCHEEEESALKSKFKKFVKEFAYVPAGASSINITTFKYREQFEHNCRQGFYKLEVNLNDLAGNDDYEKIRHNLRDKPSRFLPVCEQALKELYPDIMAGEASESTPPSMQLQLQVDADLEGTFGTEKPMRIRELAAHTVEKLVVCQGIVTSAKRARHKARKVVLRCSRCEKTKTIHVGAGLCASHLPTACDGNERGGMDKCPPNPYVIIDDLCEQVDEQTLKLQELPEHVPVGEMPRSFDFVLSQYDVDKATPGTRLTAVGIFTATEHEAGQSMGSNRQKSTSTVKYSYVQVLGIKVAQGNTVGQAAIALTSEEEERFEQLAKSRDIRDMIYKSIAPSICASAKDVVGDVKKAVACMLFGGSRKIQPDGARMRGDINVLLLGDPGTAKSQFLKFAEKASPIAVYTSGKGSSAAGLTASIVSDRNGFTLEGGAMVLADGGIVCIDEFDKMDVKDRVAIHEAMEQQTISIAKAGITTMLNTRCSVLAAANPRFGTYDDLSNTADQMDFETTILSRFDMMFLVRDVRDEERDFNLARHMAGLHSGEVEEEREVPIPTPELRKYLAYCRSRCSPRLTVEATEKLKNHYVTIRAAMKQEKSTIPITVRQLEAIIRISESLAKMELRDEADISHVDEAMRLFTVSTLDSANKDRGMGTDAMTEEEKAEIMKAEDQIRRLINRGGRKGKGELEVRVVQTAGVDERAARKAINIMLRRGELEEKANNTLVRVG